MTAADAGGLQVSDDREQSARRAARMNRERLALAHREVVMEEEAKRAADIRKNMARLKELRLAKNKRLGRKSPTRTNPQDLIRKSDSDKKAARKAQLLDNRLHELHQLRIEEERTKKQSHLSSENCLTLFPAIEPSVI